MKSRQWETDNIVETAFDPGHKHRAVIILYPVGPCFVEGGSPLNVFFDFTQREFAERDVCSLRPCHLPAGGALHKREARHNGMRLPAQRAQHPDRITGAIGLPQHLTLQHNDRIRSDNHTIRDTLCDV